MHNHCYLSASSFFAFVALPVYFHFCPFNFLGQIPLVAFVSNKTYSHYRFHSPIHTCITLQERDETNYVEQAADLDKLVSLVSNASLTHRNMFASLHET